MLEHHVVGIHRRHLQAPHLAGNAFIHRLGQDFSTLGIRMNGILQDIMIRIKRFVEVNHLHPFSLGDALYRLLDFSVPIAGTRLETGMTVRQRSHASNEEAHLRIRLAEIVHQRTVVADKFIAVVGPVARVGIVDTQMNHHNIPCKGHRILVLLLLGVRTVSLVEQGSSRLTEIAHLVGIAQHSLQLHGIGIHFPVFHACAIGNAVAHTSHLDLVLCHRPARKKQGQ